jgi:N-acyl-L-homoserine lactone synthetase
VAEDPAWLLGLLAGLPTTAPLMIQGCFASLRDGLRPPLSREPPRSRFRRHKRRSETCAAHEFNEAGYARILT